MLRPVMLNIKQHQLDSPTKLHIHIIRQNPMQLAEQHDWKGKKGCRTEKIKTNAEKNPNTTLGRWLKRSKDI